jgi:methionyl-tRNA formyltransferase
LRLVYMGTPEFAIPPLQHLLLEGQQVVAVFTRPDKPAGRGRTSTPPPVKTAALSWNLPVFQVPTLKNVEAAERITALRPEFIVVAAFGQILPQTILDIPSYGCINIHPSLLPKYRGSRPVAASILAGDVFAGVSLMKMDAGLDTGPIYSQAQIPVSQQDTTGTLTGKLSQISARMLLEELLEVSRGKLLPRPQIEAEASYYGELDKNEGKIDWRDSAVNIWRRVRAFQPWPGAFTFWEGKQLKIIEAVPLLPAGPVSEPGRTMELAGTPGSAFGITTGSGILGVRMVQMEGKRAMSSEEFLRGQRKILGSRLE